MILRGGAKRGMVDAGRWWCRVDPLVLILPEGWGAVNISAFPVQAFHGGLLSDYVKLHTAVLHNRKIQTLPPSLILPWLNFLILSRLNGGALPDIGELAFQLHVDQATALAWIMALRKLRLIDQEGDRGDLVMHDWDEWNPPSPKDPTAAERQAKRRAKLKEANTIQPNIRVTERDVTNVTNRDVTVVTERDIVTSLASGMGDCPKSANAIRHPFPAASDAEVLAIVEACVQACISIEAEPPDDEDIEAAVNLAHFNGQENVRGFRKRAPQVIKTWIERKKHEQAQQNGK